MFSPPGVVLMNITPGYKAFQNLLNFQSVFSWAHAKEVPDGC